MIQHKVINMELDSQGRAELLPPRPNVAWRVHSLVMYIPHAPAESPIQVRIDRVKQLPSSGEEAFTICDGQPLDRPLILPHNPEGWVAGESGDSLYLAGGEGGRTVQGCMTYSGISE